MQNSHKVTVPLSLGLGLAIAVVINRAGDFTPGQAMGTNLAILAFSIGLAALASNLLNQPVSLNTRRPSRVTPGSVWMVDGVDGPVTVIEFLYYSDTQDPYRVKYRTVDGDSYWGEYKGFVRSCSYPNSAERIGLKIPE